MHLEFYLAVFFLKGSVRDRSIPIAISPELSQIVFEMPV
jgi:hypothetical protein